MDELGTEFIKVRSNSPDPDQVDPKLTGLLIWIRIRIQWISGSVIQEFRSTDPDPSDIFTDPEH
jgi:hypothetical protein